MRCEITVEPDFLKAELFDRQTPEETRDALAAIAAAARKHACSQILISVRASRPISQIEQSGFLECFREFNGTPKHRIALTGDSDELKLSQQYFESVARRNGINVRSLPNEQAALDWLKDRRWTPDRSEEHTSELQSLRHLVCRLLLEKKKKKQLIHPTPVLSNRQTIPQK